LFTNFEIILKEMLSLVVHVGVAVATVADKKS